MSELAGILPFSNSVRQAPADNLGDMQVNNSSGEEIPAYAPMLLLDTVTTIYRNVTKPNADSLDACKIVFNGPSPIPKNRPGVAISAYEVLSTINGTPALGDDIGTVSGQWYLSTGQTGFKARVVSGGLCYVVPFNGGGGGEVNTGFVHYDYFGNYPDGSILPQTGDDYETIYTDIRSDGKGFLLNGDAPTTQVIKASFDILSVSSPRPLYGFNYYPGDPRETWAFFAPSTYFYGFDASIYMVIRDSLGNLYTSDSHRIQTTDIRTALPSVELESFSLTSALCVGFSFTSSSLPGKKIASAKILFDVITLSSAGASTRNRMGRFWFPYWTNPSTSDTSLLVNLEFNGNSGSFV